MDQDFQVTADPATGRVCSVRLYGHELLDAADPCRSELWVNGLPLDMRPHTDPNRPGLPPATHLKGERWVDQFAGWGLVLARRMGGRMNLKHPCFGIQTLVRRELADQTCPCPGPGGPPIEAPLYVDTFSVLNWNWRFWDADTRMIFASSHSTGPDDEFGHVGYEHDTPEACKRYMQNVWRRVYPNGMVLHGGLFYNDRTEHWLALTCRRPTVGYILNIADAGRGVSYDFTLHAPFGLGDSLQLPEIKIYHGRTADEMMRWLADYATFYYEEPPEWVHKTLWGDGLAWNNRPTWTEQADGWLERIDKGLSSGVGYSLVTNRPIQSGTTPLGYEPDPNHGTRAEFKAMVRRLADRGVPVLVWMSHAGLLYRGGDEIDDDWFLRGIDGRTQASWGNVDQGELTLVNPGHPGYIAYTKKWIRFYIQECGAKGIFFDCANFAISPDFKPRPWMRYPGDTARMAVRFMEEAYACIKECDPDAILLGEGTSLDHPINVFSIHSNPKRAIDGLGPRDFFLQLNRFAPKRMVIDQGPRFFPAAGFCSKDERPGADVRNRYLTRLLREKGGRDAWVALPGDLSVHAAERLLVVPVPESEAEQAAGVRVILPEPWAGVVRLVEETDGTAIARDDDGAFRGVRAGVYKMT